MYSASRLIILLLCAVFGLDRSLLFIFWNGLDLTISVKHVSTGTEFIHTFRIYTVDITLVHVDDEDDVCENKSHRNQQ